MNKWTFMNIKDQGHSLTFIQGHTDSTFSNFFCSESARPIEAKLYMEPPWDVRNENFFKWSRSHMTMRLYGEKLKKSSSSEPRGRWPWNLVYSIGYSSTANVFIWWPWVDLDHFYHSQICFRMLLHGWKLIQHWVLMYFQVCSNSAYPQHSGDRSRTNGHLVSLLQCFDLENLKSLLRKDKNMFPRSAS